MHSTDWGLPRNDTYHSLLLERTIGRDACGHRACLTAHLCGCDSCGCRTLLDGAPSAGVATLPGYGGANGFDGDHATLWRARGNASFVQYEQDEPALLVAIRKGA
jgi:hypothetical protein